ncbi:MAG TPA: DUF308 domain-containing protein [Rhabdochlamydiaceae bacterium]|jgi:uncharacterized membrane protein HdeD (DUF308 family)|nr:DUF308 domain-containing protein [Rhabdochlamydiaceae bacterium]
MISNQGMRFFEAVVLIGLGISAAILPSYFTFKLEQFLGVIFMASGLVQLIRVLVDRIPARSLLYFLIALLYLASGIMFRIHPYISMLSFGFILMVFLMVDGLAKMILAYEVYPKALWQGFAACGILSVIMGVSIWAEWPLTSAWPRGILAGVNLFSYGCALLGLALKERA